VSGPIEVGQRWFRTVDGERDACEVVRVTDAGRVEHRFPNSSVAFFLSEDRFRATYQRAIPLRIRVGVTADGTWLAMGSNLPDMIKAEDERDAAFQQALREDGAGPVVAWHWITAEVPMPETEQGETKGTVEP
jgi:hypothetical protein